MFLHLIVNYYCAGRPILFTKGGGVCAKSGGTVSGEEAV